MVSHEKGRKEGSVDSGILFISRVLLCCIYAAHGMAWMASRAIFIYSILLRRDSVADVCLFGCLFLDTIDTRLRISILIIFL